MTMPNPRSSRPIGMLTAEEARPSSGEEMTLASGSLRQKSRARANSPLFWEPRDSTSRYAPTAGEGVTARRPRKPTMSTPQQPTKTTTRTLLIKGNKITTTWKTKWMRDPKTKKIACKERISMMI